jgi:hypothetical protein
MRHERQSAMSLLLLREVSDLMSYRAAIDYYRQDRAARAAVFVGVRLLHRVKRLEVVHHRKPGELPSLGKPLPK